MKPIYLSSLLLLLFFISGCDDSTYISETPKDINTGLIHALKTDSISVEYTKEQIEYLKQMGMTASFTVIDNHSLVDEELTRIYENKFKGCKFLSDTYIEQFLKDKDLVMGDLSLFVGTIPPENINQFKTNLEYAKSVDENVKGYYFIRNSQREGEGNGEFYQRIKESEILPDRIGLVEGSPGGVNTGQPHQNTYEKILPKYRYEIYKVKHNTKNIIVDHNTGAWIRIIAPKELFKTEDTEIVDRQVLKIKRDPAIVFRVQGGWMALTAWE